MSEKDEYIEVVPPEKMEKCPGCKRPLPIVIDGKIYLCSECSYKEKLKFLYRWLKYE